MIRYNMVFHSLQHSVPISKIIEKLMKSAISKSKPYSYTSLFFVETMFCSIKKAVILVDKFILQHLIVAMLYL